MKSLLDGVGRDMSTTGNTMKLVEGQTKKLVDQAGGPGWFCLTVTLACIAFSLFLLIIYT